MPSSHRTTDHDAVDVDQPPLALRTLRRARPVAGPLPAGHHLLVEREGRAYALTLPEGPTSLGRRATADLELDDPTVSRRHALIRRDGDVVELFDDTSLNGVLVNGERVSRRVLQAGDRVELGRVVLHLHVQAELPASLRAAA